MKQAMITVCGKFSDTHRISNTLLNSVAKLANALGRNDCMVAYANSMDNGQMPNLVKNFALEADSARAQLGVSIFFVVYEDEIRSSNLYAAFSHLRDILPRHIALVLVDIGNQEALTRDQKVLLSQLRGLFFLHGARGTNKETVKILLRDIALGL